MKKQKNKQGIKASKLAKAENKLKKQAEQMITVKNAEGEPDTEAKILIQNKINYTPKVSVIIPVYNVEEYLRECLDSVVNQTLKEIEIICVDDGSTDNSLEILKEYAKKDNRISVLTQENSGAGLARNVGINAALGTFIAFMDPDDFYPNNHTLERIYNTAITYDVWVCGGSFSCFKDNEILKDASNFGTGYFFKEDGYINYTDYQWDCGYWRFIYNKEFLKENQIYFPDYLRGQDPPFFIKAMALAKRFYALKEATYVYRYIPKARISTLRKAIDYTKSLSHCLELAQQFKLDTLTQIITKRINHFYENNVYKPFCKQSEFLTAFNKLNSIVLSSTENNIYFLRKRVYLINNYTVVNNIGGTTTVFKNFAKTLAKKFNVTCLTYAKTETLNLDLDDISFVNLAKRYKNASFSHAINEYLHENAADLLIWFFPDLILEANLDKFFDSIPRILMFHSRPDFYFYEKEKKYSEKFEQLYVNTTAQILQSSFYDKLPECVKAGKVVVIGNPTQVLPSKQINQRKKIVYLSRIDECKGIEFLLMSYSKIAKQYSDWELHIYGQFMSEKYKEKIMALRDRLALKKYVKFKGCTSTPLDTLKNYDFCVFPSYFEGFSIGLSEALSVGLPCVALAGCSGVNEQIMDNFNGFLTSENYEEYARKIEYFITHPKERIEMGKNAQKSIIPFSSDKIYSKWYDVIDAIIYKKPIQETIEKKKVNIFSLEKVKHSARNNTLSILSSHHHDIDVPTEIIISLTSYPARIKTVNQAIESLLNQTMKADKVILWLAPEQFPNKEKDLPEQLLALCDKGLTIDWYHDIKSYKKLIPTLKKYPEAIIVTADDDLLYDKNWLERLYISYCKKNNVIWAHRIHKITMNKFQILPYKKWNFSINTNNAQYGNFCTTGGGVLYPPYCLYKDVLDEDKFMSLSPNADDIWFWAMLVLNRQRIVSVPNSTGKIECIEGTQNVALWHNNLENNENDIQLKNILKEYPQILKRLRIEQLEIVRKGNILNLLSYLLFPYNLCKILWLKKTYQKLALKPVCTRFLSARIDIKNFGNENNAVEIITSAKVSKPAWFINAQGHGQVVESSKKIQNITIKAIQDGKLRLDFRGQDKRFEGVRFPVWADYKSIKIDGKEILSAPIATWHDKPFRYEMPVKDGQIVKVEVVQQYHQYSKDELKDVILKLNPNSEYIKENIEKLTNKIYKKITVNNTTIKSSPQTTLFARVKQNVQEKIKLWQDKLSFAHKIAPIMEMMQKNQAQTLQILQEIQTKNVNLENKNNELKKEIEVLKGFFSTQLTDFKKQQEERSKQLLATGDRLSAELQRVTAELQSAEQSQTSEIKATLSEFIAQLAVTENKLSAELQRTTAELQSAEQSQASEIKATLREFIAQLAVTENKLSAELQRATNELQNAEQSQTSEIKATLSEFIAQLAVTENKLSTELQRTTAELQNAEQSQASEIKATLSDFIAQLAATENKLTAELQRATNELQSTEQTQASEIKATLSDFIAQLAATENKLTAELQRATEKLQNSGISEISEIKTYCADFAQYLDNAQAKMLSELNNQRETALQNKNNIIAGINQTEQSLQMQASKSHELVQEQMAILDRVQERLEDLSALKEIDFAQKSELDVLSQDIEKQKSELLEKVQNLQNKAQLQYQELNFADLLHDSTHSSSWLKDKNFALYGWAANYSFIYTLFRILDNVQPAHILEMGLGQTSMVTTQYIANKKPAADLDIIENDESWIKVYEPKLAKSQNIKLHQCDIEFFDYEGEQSRKYKELNKITGDKKYNLIIVDGPFGGAQKLPRSNIVELVEHNLAQDFIIMFDDAERAGEQNTIAQTQAKLTSLGIKFGTQQRNALKSQVLIFSKSCEFAKYL